MCIDAKKTYVATMKTSQGDIVIALDPTHAPKAVNNFVVLARYHFYDGTTFHRIVPGFVDQGGGIGADPGTSGPGYDLPFEKPFRQYAAYDVAMAASSAGPSGSQFFFDHAGSADKTLKLYEGHYHDLLNDIGKEAVMADVLGWIDARL